MEKKCRGMGIKIDDDLCLYTLQFADDQILCAGDKDDLQYMTRKLIEEYEHWGLSMNLDKTKYLCVGEVATDIVLENQEKISSCNQYKYLGVLFDEQGTDEIEIKTRNMQARRMIATLNGVLWSGEMGKRRKMQIYEVVIKSGLLYGSETWRMTEAIKRKLEATEMDALRRAARISRRDRIRNEEVKRRMGIEGTIIQDIEQKQLVWYGHIKRMNNNRLPKRIMDWFPNRKRKRGRPRKSWSEGIRKAMSVRNLNEEDCEDRRGWKLGIGQRRKTF